MAAVNMMLKSGLVESDNFKRKLDSAEDSVKVTYSGFIHMRLLLGSLEYLYGILPTTPVFNASIADRIKTSLEREASGRIVSSAMQLSAVHALLEHLEEAFHKEMSSFPAFGGVGTGAYYALSVRHPPVAKVRAAVAAGDRRPEVIEHVGVEAEALARLELDCPDAHAICLG